MNFIEIIDYLNHYSAIVVTLATLILVLVTKRYVSLTNAILEEERKTKKIREIKYKLENVYSPINLMLMDYRENRGLGRTLQDMIESQETFSNDYRSLSRNYDYIMRIEMTKYYNKILTEFNTCIEGLMFTYADPEGKLKLKLRADNKVFNSLNERIDNFIYYVDHVIQIYNKLLDENGIDDVNLNIEESDIERFRLPPVKILEY